MRLDMSLENFFSNTLVANLALLLSISVNRIKVASVRAGSVVVDFKISPAVSVAHDIHTQSLQVTDLASVVKNLTVAIVTNTIGAALNMSVLQVFAVVPIL
jgi:hypothetical protein